MRFIDMLFGDHTIDATAKARQIQTEREIEAAQKRLTAAHQNIESGSRVLENMSGMMLLLRTVKNDRK